MRIALETWSNDFGVTLATCQRAEQLGFDAFYYGESPQGLNLDCWTTLAALAHATSSIRLGPVITNVIPDYRSLALLAKQTATVAVVAEGRLDFRSGVGAAQQAGRGWWGQVGVDYRPYNTRLGFLTEALQTLPAYWANQHVRFGDGESTVLGFACPPIPITIAAKGKRALQAAAQEAQFCETSFCTPAEVCAYADSLKELGVSPDNSPPLCSLEIDGFVGSTKESVNAVVAAARAERQGEDLAAVFSRALRGQPAEIAEQLNELSQAGVAQVVVALHDPHDPDAIGALAAARDLLR